MPGTIIFWLIFVVVLLLFLFMGIYTVKQQTFAVIERFGKYARIAGPGLHIKWPIIEAVVGRVSIRVRELNVEVKTKLRITCLSIFSSQSNSL